LALYLWIGKSVEFKFRAASLRILKSFMLTTLKERINYLPDYVLSINAFEQSLGMNGLDTVTC